LEKKLIFLEDLMDEELGINSDIIYEVKDRIAFITINRPQKLNTLTPESAEELGMAWERFRDDDDALVAIIRGTGEKSFCIGYEMSPEALKISNAKKAKLTVPTSFEIWKPVIAAINGYCLGGGWYIAQECDIRVAGDDAQFGVPQVRWGLMTPISASLERSLMPGHALELLLVGDKIDAKRAYEIGFVNYLVRADQVVLKAMELAKKICENGPIAVKKAKELFYRARSLNEKDTDKLTWRLFEENEISEDCQEGVKAFIEKRNPKYKNA
jgi:enoyl-CoA hydratase/carnithine racemase